MEDRAAFEIHGQFTALLDETAVRDIAACHQATRQVDDVADPEVFEILALDGGRQNLFHSTTPSWDRIS